MLLHTRFFLGVPRYTQTFFKFFTSSGVNLSVPRFNLNWMKNSFPVTKLLKPGIHLNQT